jgi:hypothetical protein
VPFALANETPTGLVNVEGCRIYKYEHYLRAPFMQDPGMFYWFDVTAVSVDAGLPPMWRWQEANRSPVFLCHAPAAEKTESTPWRSIVWPTFPETYSDLAFTVTSHGPSEPNIIRLVADDWKCERKTPVTAAVWWGSYIGYRYEAFQPQLSAPPVKPDYFLLRIWDDVPASADVPFSHPNNIIWEYKAHDYDEVLVGYDKHPEGQAGPREPVFRYSVRLPKPAWFWQEDVNNIYWFSVVAVYDRSNPSYDWGWTNHMYNFNDDAVAGYLDISGVVPIWRWEELYDQTGKSEDMSFILFTWPWPPCWGYLTQCHGDADGDGWVKGSDFLALKNSWYKCYPDPLYDPCADFDRNGCVKGSDFLILKKYWYTSPPPDCPRGGKWPP